MTLVTWGAAPSGFLLAATVREHFRRTSGEAERLGASLYTDDFLCSYRSEEDAMRFADLARETFAGAGMGLAKRKSSSPAALDHLRATDVRAKNFDTGSAGLFKILRVAWNTDSDTFHFIIPDSRSQLTPVTKRHALSVIAAVFDPLGWIMLEFSKVHRFGWLLRSLARVWLGRVSDSQRKHPEYPTDHPFHGSWEADHPAALECRPPVIRSQKIFIET